MLEFNVTNQSLKRIDKFNPATDSVEYLKAQFNFLTDDWNGKTKKALFRSGTVSYEAAINSSGVCVVPWEILVAPNNKFSALSGGCIKLYVSVVGTAGTVQIPTKECRVELAMSGLTESLNGAEPTPNLYEQFVDTIKADNDETEANIKASNAEVVASFTEKTKAVQDTAAEIKAYDESIKNSYANSFKGITSGEVVRVDDVSPIEHTVTAKVQGKNLFNYEAFKTVGANHGTVSFDDAGVITLTATEDDCYTQYGNFPVNARIYVNKGETITLSWETDAVDTLTSGLVYILSNGEAANYKSAPATSKKVTYTAPEGCGFVVFRLGVSVAGDVIKYWNLQIEKGDVATEYEPYIEPSTVNVIRCSKNLIPFPYYSPSTTMNGVTFSVKTSGAITVTGTPTAIAYIPIYSREFPAKKGRLTASMVGNASNTLMQIVFYNENSETIAEYTLKTGETKTIDIPEGYGKLLCNANVKRSVNGTPMNGEAYPQIEFGEVATEYELGAVYKTYTPSSDGSCDIISVSPTMTLLTNTTGAIIDCEYNRDTTAVMGDLKACLNEVKELHQTTLDLLGGAS